MNESYMLTMVPPIEVGPGDALVPSADGSRAAFYRMTRGEWVLMAQYERVGDIMISVETL